jgi:hypothetical protein
MTYLRRFFLATFFGLFLTLLLITPATAGGPAASPSAPPPPIAPVPVPKPGICAPWHKCVAGGALATVVLYLIATGGMYMIQRKGFDTLEPRQGSPRGVPVQKK